MYIKTQKNFLKNKEKHSAFPLKTQCNTWKILSCSQNTPPHQGRLAVECTWKSEKDKFGCSAAKAANNLSLCFERDLSPASAERARCSLIFYSLCESLTVRQLMNFSFCGTRGPRAKSECTQSAIFLLSHPQGCLAQRVVYTHNRCSERRLCIFKDPPLKIHYSWH